jgi:hypothetical protein
MIFKTIFAKILGEKNWLFVQNPTKFTKKLDLTYIPLVFAKNAILFAENLSQIAENNEPS